MRVACGGAVGDHGHGQVGGVAGRVEDFDVEHGSEAAEPLCADAEAVDFVVELDAELFGRGFGAARDQVLDVDGVHEGLLGEEHGLLRSAADADAEHPWRAPAGAHGGDGLQHPLDDRVRGIEHDELALGFGASTFGCDGDVDGVAANELHIDDGRGVVFGVFTRTGGVGKDRAAQLVIGIEIGAADAFIDHLLQIERGFAGRGLRSGHPCRA